MKKLLSRTIAIAMLLAPGLAFAAYNDVQLGPSDTVLSVNSATVTISSASTTLESIVVGSTSFDLTFAASSAITITAPGINVTAMAPTQSLTTSCSGGVTTLVITANAAGTATIQPDATACGTAAAASSGGNNGAPVASSGGGGGGYSAPVSKPVVKAPIIAPASVPAPTQSSSLSSDFGMGDENAEVATLQSFLEMKGFLHMPSGLARGYFGAATKKALKAYQKSVGINPTGYVGAKTRASIGGVQSSTPVMSAPSMSAGGAFTRDLEVGIEGADVKQLQVFLNTHGFVIAGSGPGSAGNETMRFGGATKSALQKFQKANGISPASGYFGAKTRAIVNAMK